MVCLLTDKKGLIGTGALYRVNTVMGIFLIIQKLYSEQMFGLIHKYFTALVTN